MDDLMHLLAIRNLENAEMHNGPIFRTFNRHDPFNELNDRQFINMFRLTKELSLNLIERLTPFLTPARRSTDLDAKTKILTALRFYASGSYQLDIGSNKYIDMSQPSVSRSVNEVTQALNNPTIFNEWVSFPNTLARLNVLRGQFHEQHGFPGVIGCIDCTHVAIIPPYIEDPEYPEHIYVNRKHYHSINVQLVCDANLKILNVNSRYPGSTNDAYIWRQSNVQRFLRELHAAGHKDYFLLGDSGYPLRTWLLTPFQNVEPNTPESNYNYIHKHTRVKIECCNGVLKARFRCLLKDRVLHYTPETACKIINACVILHNMCMEHNVPEAEEENDENADFGIINNDENEDGNLPARAVNPDLADGQRARFTVVRSLHNRNL